MISFMGNLLPLAYWKGRKQMEAITKRMQRGKWLVKRVKLYYIY